MIQTLITHGHGYHDVLEMDFGDCLCFLKVIAKHKNEQIKMMAVSFRVAQASEQDWKKWYGTA